MLVPSGGRDSEQRLELMAQSGATALACTPSYAIRLAEVAREAGFDISRIPMKMTVHAGEPGANVPATKNRIEKLWSAKCFDHAGASEVGAHSFECQAQPGGIHLIESEFIAEVLDLRTGQPVTPGESGELVITNLGRWGFPVVRYRTGDVVRANLAQCDCGRTFMRFDGGILGRADDMHVEVELADGADTNIVHAIAGKLDTMLSFRPSVHLVSRGTLPRFEMKSKRFHVERQN